MCKDLHTLSPYNKEVLPNMRAKAIQLGAATFAALLSSMCGFAQQANLAIAVAPSTFTQGQVGATYKITVTNGGAATTSSTFTVNDSIPLGLTATKIDGGADWDCTKNNLPVPGPATLTCTSKTALAASQSSNITLTVDVASDAPASLDNTATVAGGGGSNGPHDSVTVPTPINPATPPTKTVPEGVDLLIGIGSRVGGHRVQNYQVSSTNYLQLTNYGNALPEFLAGLSMPFCIKGEETNLFPCTSKNGYVKGFAGRVGAFVTVQFTSGSPQTISGYTIGPSIHLSKYAHLLVGYSVMPVNEISPGFMAYYLSNHPQTSNWDGVSVAGYTAGNPLTIHYRGGVFIGIALPVSLGGLLQGNIKLQ
jgi:uncharacterized repeat protein (TIGR01451 family)